MIEIQGLTVKYKKRTVLENINLKLEAENYGILGPNGSGKTTLFRALTGGVKVKSGLVKGEQKSLKIGYLPQKFGCMQELSVWEQMQYFSYLKGIKPENEEKEIIYALRQVGMEEYAKQKCKKLSGGMIRRIGIAQAILGQTDMILLDEPTVGLDIEERSRFYQIMNNIHGKCPLLIASHIAEDVSATCKNTIIIREGRIIFSGQTNQIANIAKNKENATLTDGYIECLQKSSSKS